MAHRQRRDIFAKSRIDDSPANVRFYVPLSIVVLILSGWLIFFRLGHYPLWGDEAETAIFARAVARTGDTSPCSITTCMPIETAYY